MKALVYTAERQVAYREEPEPEPRSGEVLVAVDAAGICGSDMHAYLGHDPRRVPPLVLGHEVAGTVLDGPLAGKRVVVNPLVTCGECDVCLDGRTNLCPRRDIIGMYRPGAFAERLAIPARNLIEMPPGMDPAHAALAEPAATAVHAVNLAARAARRPLADLDALVLGGGSVGLFAALSLGDQGSRQVALAETNPLRRSTAEATGIGRVLDPRSEPPPEGAYDVIIDAVGGHATRAMASAAVRPGGVILHIGLMDNEGGLDVRRITLQEITFIGTYTYTMVDMRSTVAKLATGALGDLGWVEQRALADGAGAFDDLLNGRTAAPKIVLRP